MAFTVKQVCDRARRFLTDPNGVRFKDEDLAAWTNDAVQILAVNRPDLFHGSYENMPTGALELGQNVPLEDRLLPAMADYVVARANSIEDEYAVDGRARTFFELAGLEIGGEQ